MSFRNTSRARAGGHHHTHPAVTPQPISTQEKQVFLATADRLSDVDLFTLLAERRGWSLPASSTSASTNTGSQASTMSLQTIPSLRGSSISSKRGSIMSLDSVQQPFEPTNESSGQGATTAEPQVQADGFQLTPEELMADIIAQSEAKGSTKSTGRPVRTHGLTLNPPTQLRCTYCAGPKRCSFGKVSDWKVHETRRHQPSRIYLCAHNTDPSDPCRGDFLSSRGLQNHHKEVHEPKGCMGHCLGPRIVSPSIFACGFRGCTDLFTDDPLKGRDAWADRCDHVARHFKKGYTIAQWSYSHMILNLLRQPNLLSLWDTLAAKKQAEKRLARAPEYSWLEEWTHEMRRMLETYFVMPPQTATEVSNVNGLLHEVYELAVPDLTNQCVAASTGMNLLNDYDAPPPEPAGLTTAGSLVPTYTSAESQQATTPEDFAENEPTIRVRGRTQALGGTLASTKSSRSRSKSSKENMSCDAFSDHNAIDDSNASVGPPVPPMPANLQQYHQHAQQGSQQFNIHPEVTEDLEITMDDWTQGQDHLPAMDYSPRSYFDWDF